MNLLSILRRNLFSPIGDFIMRKENMFGACAFVVVSSMFYVVGLVL